MLKLYRPLFTNSFRELFEDFDNLFERYEVVPEKGEYIERTTRNGVLHSTQGKPARITYKDGKVVKEEYFVDGVLSTKEEVEKAYQKDEDEKIHFISLGEKTFKVTGKKLRELQKQLEVV